jgi:hypothetical protein
MGNIGRADVHDNLHLPRHAPAAKIALLLSEAKISDAQQVTRCIIVTALKLNHQQHTRYDRLLVNYTQHNDCCCLSFTSGGGAADPAEIPQQQVPHRQPIQTNQPHHLQLLLLLLAQILLPKHQQLAPALHPALALALAQALVLSEWRRLSVPIS